MHGFFFQSPTKFYFGRGAESHLGEALQAEGASKVLIHVGQHSVQRSGLLDRARQQLDAAKIPYVELAGAKPNPRSDLVEEGAALCRRENVDYILALGGGSCLDSAKAIAILAKTDAKLFDIYMGKQPVSGALPLATVMTLPATGSEASDSSVINFMKENKKLGYSSNLIRPRLAFLNPELTYSLPRFQTFCGIADMMAHTMERYFNNTLGADISNAWAEGLLREIIKNAYTLLHEPDNYDARANIMWASTVAHNGLLGLGVEKEDWSSHQLEHELSLRYDVAHGAGLAVIFPNWLRYAALRNPGKIARFAREVFGIRGDMNDLHTWALRGIAALQRFFRDCGLPLTFEELGARREDIPALAANVRRSGREKIGGYIAIGVEDFKAVFELCCGESLIGPKA